MSEKILSVQDLRKTYRMKNGNLVEAVKGISFDVNRGKMHYLCSTRKRRANSRLKWKACARRSSTLLSTRMKLIAIS